MSENESNVPRERDPEQRKTLEDALRIAYDVHNAAEGTPAMPSADDLLTLAQGFIILAQDLAGYWEAIQQQKQYCGWCEHAGIPRGDLPAMTLEDIRNHTVACEHNPLVQELQVFREERRIMFSVLGIAADIAAGLGPLDVVRAVRDDHVAAGDTIARTMPVYVAAIAWREAVKARDWNRDNKDAVTAAQAARDDLERLIDFAIDAEPTDNPAEWPDAGDPPPVGFSASLGLKVKVHEGVATPNLRSALNRALGAGPLTVALARCEGSHTAGVCHDPECKYRSGR